jgi:hypothetical protein
MKYAKHTENAKTVKISKTFVMGGCLNSMVLVIRKIEWSSSVIKRNNLFELEKVLSPFIKL